MARTQKNKATSFHLGQLKAKLAKLKRELLTPSSGGGGGGPGFDVARTGVASVGFIGFPSVGKSTLMSKITGQHSEAAAYEFTTLTSVPGQVVYNGERPYLPCVFPRVSCVDVFVRWRERSAVGVGSSGVGRGGFPPSLQPLERRGLFCFGFEMPA